MKALGIDCLKILVRPLDLIIQRLCQIICMVLGQWVLQIIRVSRLNPRRPRAIKLLTKYDARRIAVNSF